MNFEYFIARRLINANGGKSNISAPIIKIAISAIAIGMVMMIISVATGLGLQQKIREKVSAFNGHIIISNFDNNASDVSIRPISTKQDFYPKFKNVDGISHIQAVATKTGIIRTASAFEGVILKGVGKDFSWDYIREFIVSGKLPDFKGSLNNQILISEFLAKRLGLKVGDKFSTYFMKDGGNALPNLRVFSVSGIYNSGFQEFDSNYIIGDIRHIQRLNKWQPDEVGQFEVFIDDFSQIEQKGKEVYEQTGSLLNTKTIVQKYFYIFEWLKLFDFNIMLMLGVMVVVSTINMVVALLVLILERTQMIGILKAVGAANWSVRKIFLYNAFYLILRGLLWGNFIGIGMLLLQRYFGIIKLDPASYYVNEAPVYISWDYILLLNLGTMLVCLLVLLIPSYIVTKISPVKAIRFE
ncbi:FtsX-like permease family protein [Flavobacterium sp.]|uniref:ABC transporter permease n=1 Tax=Flavobacterium sp. TaxID=239 RepID=UPI00260D837D|nr:FtsX-like permease family protein [Flavobacterium sp.]